MEYFYVPPDCIHGDQVTVEGDEFVHLTHVMRKESGDQIWIVDGVANAYEATIREITRRTALCTIFRHEVRLHESPVDVILGAGILKNSARFDFLVEKATELGVRRIVPLQTERTIPRHAKCERWQKLALAAMKQSGRCILPSVGPLTRLQDFVNEVKTGARCFMLHEQFRTPLPPADVAEGTIAVCVGPEGGFSAEEAEEALMAGFQLAGLGPRRLRTETAAIAAMSRLLAVGPPVE